MILEVGNTFLTLIGLPSDQIVVNGLAKLAKGGKLERKFDDVAMSYIM